MLPYSSVHDILTPEYTKHYSQSMKIMISEGVQISEKKEIFCFDAIL
jgi:hypothetical protein